MQKRLTHHDGLQMADLLNPMNGYRGQQVAHGLKPKNHMAQNRAYLKLKEDQFREKEEKKNGGQSKGNLPVKYQGIQPKIRSNRPHTALPASRPIIQRQRQKSLEKLQKQEKQPKFEFGHGFKVRSNSNEPKLEIPIKPKRPQSSKIINSAAMTKFESTKIAPVAKVQPKNVQNVVVAAKQKENVQQRFISKDLTVIDEFPQMKKQRIQSANSHKNYGKTPKYIEKYKKEAVEKQKNQALEQAKAPVPNGMRQLPEEERISTLDDLISTKKELNQILNSLPISMRSQNSNLRKRELETQLNQVESGIQLFQRKIVYVRE